MDLAFLLAHASHVLSTELTAELAGLGITPRGSCVLSAALTGEKTQIQLADTCGLDKTTMVVTVDELEKAGLVERQTSPVDRRARIIVVTPQGREVHAKAADVVARVYEDVLSSLPADERDGLVRGLSRLVENRLSTPVACQRAPRRRM
ncbi:MarR family winged helix-turn-helix transcriptional regulator [Actinophytocola algeriensis]|uniref:DNA-binding MarR family transcriptional regulator n=1 Tax=Actinophytocola algeriensis TaxID=1768010 RepID=A0A7W7VDT3_9PSEU|nr:MarR family transcriptional regulator [Actinophytocola algeriensis]MBB4906526.1 DNA-binding MarR family transcriptional regulator [Actinophytocola algeriensis]MBE1478007.1 DNA-binding MarR family transcriptional regulator [Actinophytocola algeriensis]